MKRLSHLFSLVCILLLLVPSHVAAQAYGEGNYNDSYYNGVLASTPTPTPTPTASADSSPTPTSGGQFPITGSNMLLVGGSGALLVAGGLLLLARRRRNLPL